MMHLLKSLTPFKPTKFSGCALWLAADRGVTTVDGKVSVWADQSGNGNHATQSTSADYRPLYVASAQGGRPTLRFGLNDRLQASHIDSNNLTVFAVATKSSNTESYGQVIDDRQAGETAGWALYCRFGVWAAVQKITTWGQNYITQVVANNGQTYILGATFNSSSTKLHVNGTTYTDDGETGSINYGSNPVISIGSDGASGDYFAGDISEIIIFNRALTDAERVKVEQYLSGKFSITLS